MTMDKPLSEHVTREQARELLDKSNVLLNTEIHLLERRGNVTMFSEDLEELIAFAYEQGHQNGVISTKEGRE